MEVGNLIRLRKFEWYNPANDRGMRGWVMTNSRTLWPNGPVFFHKDTGIILDIKSAHHPWPTLGDTVTDQDRWFMVSYPGGTAWFHEDNLEPA